MKMDKKHSFCLVALFLIGNMIISFPKGEGQKGSLWGFFICILVSFGICAFYLRLQSENAFGNGAFSLNSKNKIFSTATFTVFALLCVFSFTVCCKEYIVLVDTVRLKSTPRFIIAAIFILLSLLISLCKEKVLKSFCLISFVVVIICSGLMFVLSVSSMKPSLLASNFPVSIKDCFIQALTYFIHSFGQIIIVLYFIGHLKKEEAKKLQLFGIGAGSAVFFVCLLQVLLLLGPFATKLLDFPYAAATSSITAAKSYSRLDGFTYYIYFICSLIKASIILATLIKAAKEINEFLSKAVTVVCLISAFLFSVITPFQGVIKTDPFNLIFLLIEIAVPISLCFKLKQTKTNE